MEERVVVEDSTKGKALMRPKTYKGDSFVQVWLDRRKLAALSVWLDKNEMKTRFMSDVVRMALDQIYEHLVNNGVVDEIDTVSATRILEGKYRVGLNPKGRGERNLLHNMILSEQKDEELNSCKIVNNEESSSIYERNRKYFKDEKVVPDVAKPVDATKNAMELWPDLVLRIPSKEEMDEMKERKRLADIEMVRRRDEIRAKEIAEKEAEKDAAKAIKEQRKLEAKLAELEMKLELKKNREKKGSDTPRIPSKEETDEHWERIRRRDEELRTIDMTSAALKK